MKVREIPLEKIFVTKNVRFDTDEELGEQIESMLKYGQLQPIGVFPRGERFELVFGHRRLRAAGMNNDPTIACHILENLSEADIPLIKLQENTVRKQLTNDEILAAADEIKRRNPGLSDSAVDKMLGKSRGWLGFRRSLAKAYGDLAAAGLDAEKLKGMSGTEILEIRARLREETPKGRKSMGAYHRKDVPSAGFRIVNSPGPNVVVVCASKTEKLRVLRTLRHMDGATA